MVNVGHATALAAHLRYDANGSVMNSAIGSKTFHTKNKMGKD